MMDETFDVFLNGMETNCRKAEISELLRSRTEPSRVEQPPQKSHRVPDSGFTSTTEEMAKDLVKRAQVCTNEAESLEQEHKDDLSLLHDYTQKSSPLNDGAVELIEMSKNMYVCDLNVGNIGANIFPEMIAKSRELNAEARKRNHLARNAFDMTAFTMELQKIQDQKQKKTALIMERDAQMGLLEELSRDVEARQLEYDGVNAETEKLLAQLDEINATIAVATAESENASSALAAGIQKMGALQRQVEQFAASEKERIDRETAAKSALAAATAENSKLEQQIQKAEADHRRQTEQEEAKLLELQQALQNIQKVNDDELRATTTQLETFTLELSRAQQEIDRIAEVKRTCIEEQVATETVSVEIADLEQQIGTVKAEIQKIESVLEAARLENEAAVAAKTTTVESAQKELAEKESGLAVGNKSELLEKSLELRMARDTMAKEIKHLNMSAFSAEANFRRVERKALNKSKEKETPNNKNKIKKAVNWKSEASKSGQMAKGDKAEVPAPRVEKKQQSQPKSVPIEQAAFVDDSLYNGSDDDEEDGDDALDFNLSFASDRPTNTQSSAAVPLKKAEEAPKGKNDVSGRIKKAADRKAVASKSGKNRAKGDHAEVPPPRVESKQQSQPKSVPIEQAAFADDSLYNGNDDEEEDGDDAMNFNLSFASDRPTNTQPSAAVPMKFDEAPKGKGNASGRIKKEADRKAVAKSGQNLTKGDHPEVPPPRVEKKQQSQPESLPIEQAAFVDDSLYNGSDDDEEDGDDAMDFNLSFVSDRPTNTQSSASVPSKFADSPIVTEHSSITFDPSQFQTSTPIQNRAFVKVQDTPIQKRARGRAPSQALKKKQAPQKLTATRRGREKK